LAAHITVFIHAAHIAAWACRGIAFVFIHAVAIAAWACRGVAPVISDIADLLADRWREHARRRDPRPAAPQRALMAAPPVVQKPQRAAHLVVDGTCTP